MRCYLPIHTGEHILYWPNQTYVGTQFTYLEGMESWVDLGVVYTITCLQTVTHKSSNHLRDSDPTGSQTCDDR